MGRSVALDARDSYGSNDGAIRIELDHLFLAGLEGVEGRGDTFLVADYRNLEIEIIEFERLSCLRLCHVGTPR